MGRSRGTGLGKQQVEGLADGLACALSGRRANTAEWQAVLPRRHVDDKSKERYVRRRLANPLISPLRVMPGFIPEMAEMAGSNGKGVPQNKIYHMNVPCDALRHERHSGYRFASKDPFYSERSAAALVGRAGSTAVRAGRYPAHGGGEWPFQADCSQRGSRTSREAKTGRPARKGAEAGRRSETR